MKPCCVPGCKDTKNRRFMIPTLKRVRDLWLERIGNERLYGLKLKTLQKNHLVCGLHFDKICQRPDGRLMAFAVPTLHLPNYNQPSTPSTCFSYSPEKPKYITPQKLRGMYLFAYKFVQIS
jgi:hypothetical protein